MKRMLTVLAVTLVLTGILVVTLASTIFAAGPQGNGSGNNFGPTGGSTIDVVSKLLGLTPEQIQDQRQAGKSLVQIAATKNVTEVALINAIITDKQAAVQKLVTDGKITQAQADQMLAQMKERVKLAVNRTTIGPPAWMGTNNNRQAGFCGNQGNCTGISGNGFGAGGMMRGGGMMRSGASFR